MRYGVLSFVGPAKQLRSALRLLVALQAKKHVYWPDIAPRLTAGIKPLLGPDSLTLYISGLREVGRAFMASRDRAMHLASMAALVLDGNVSVEPTKGRAWLVRIEPEP